MEVDYGSSQDRLFYKTPTMHPYRAKGPRKLLIKNTARTNRSGELSAIYDRLDEACRSDEMPSGSHVECPIRKPMRRLCKRQKGVEKAKTSSGLPGPSNW